MGHLITGLPGAGKTYGLRKRALQYVLKGRSVVWLTHLRRDQERTYNFFTRELGPDRVIKLPKKHLVCPYLRGLAWQRYFNIYYQLAQQLLCAVCTLECPYKKLLEEAKEKIRKDGVIAIGGLPHLPILLHLGNVLAVVDEYDATYPALWRIYREYEVATVLAIIDKLARKVTRSYDRKVLIDVLKQRFLIDTHPLEGKEFYPREVYLEPEKHNLPLMRKNTYYVTATMNPQRPIDYGDLYLLLGLDPWVAEELEINKKLQFTEVLPPNRPDRFLWPREFHDFLPAPRPYPPPERETLRNYPHITLGQVYKQLIDTALRLVKDGYSVLITPRSKYENQLIEERLNILGVKYANSDMPYALFERIYRESRLGVIYVGGPLHRSVDVDADVIFAFHQHPPPEQIPLFYHYHPGTRWHPLAAIIPFYRADVQTWFRGLRKFDKPHTLVLLDIRGKAAIRYYPHIFSYVIGKSNKSVIFKAFPIPALLEYDVIKSELV